MEKPNIIYIYCDQLRTDALGCYGNKYTEMKTPNIDRIAEMGVKFENCFCNSPVCVPSRVSNLTGLYPEDTGVYHNEAALNKFHLDRKFETFPDVFGRNGYKIANFGKVHIPRDLFVNKDGIQIFHHSNSIGSKLRYYKKEIKNLITQKHFIIGGTFPEGRKYTSEKVTKNAINWLKKEKGPYLVRISYIQPHTPVLPPHPYDTLYQEGDFPNTINMKGELSEFEKQFAKLFDVSGMRNEEIYLAQVHYFGLVAWIDAQVGKIFDFLENSGQLNNTIVILSSDHGVSLGENGSYAKHSFAPQVHRVPFLIAGPHIDFRGTSRKDICESLDLPKTLFNLTGIDCPSEFKGRDLFSSEPPEAIFSSIGFGHSSSYAFPMSLYGKYLEGNGWPRRACIRTSKYRLDKTVRMNGKPVKKENEDLFLVNWKEDPDEIHNLINDPNYKVIVEKLSAMLDNHISKSIEPPEEYMYS